MSSRNPKVCTEPRILNSKEPKTATWVLPPPYKSLYGLVIFRAIYKLQIVSSCCRVGAVPNLCLQAPTLAKGLAPALPPGKLCQRPPLRKPSEYAAAAMRSRNGISGLYRLRHARAGVGGWVWGLGLWSLGCRFGSGAFAPSFLVRVL